MTDKLTEVGRYNGMEMNVEETKVMRISRQSSPVQIMSAVHCNAIKEEEKEEQ